MPRTLRKWRARRVGGNMTINGEDAVTRLDVKITNVESIFPPTYASDNFVLATDKRGDVHKLLIG